MSEYTVMSQWEGKMSRMAIYRLIRYTFPPQTWAKLTARKKSIDGSRHMTIKSGLQNIKYMIIRIHIKHAFHKSNIIVPGILNQRFSVRLHGSDPNSDGPVERDGAWFANFHPAYCNLVCTGRLFVQILHLIYKYKIKMQTVNNERLLSIEHIPVTFLKPYWHLYHNF